MKALKQKGRLKFLFAERAMAPVLRSAFFLYFSNIRLVLHAYLPALAPFAAYLALIQIGGPPLLVAIVGLLTFVGIVGFMAVTLVLSDVRLQKTPDVSMAFRRSFELFWRAFVTFLLQQIYVVVGLLSLIAPGVRRFLWFILAMTIVATESQSGTSALQRSREIGEGFYGRNFAVIAIAFVIPPVAIGLVLGILAVLFSMPPALVSVLLLSAVMLMEPLVPVVMFVLYHEMVERRGERPLAQEAEVDRVISGLHHPNPEVRKETIAKIEKQVSSAGALPPAVTDHLQQGLDDDDFDVRRMAAAALGTAGVAGAVSKLSRMCAKTHEAAREAAAEALAKISTKEATDAVEAGLRSENGEAQLAMLGAVEHEYFLGRGREIPDQIIKALVDCTRAAERRVREGATTALYNLSRLSAATAKRLDGFGAEAALRAAQSRCVEEHLRAFTVYMRSHLRPGQTERLLVYVHDPDALADVDRDSHHRLGEEVVASLDPRVVDATRRAAGDKEKVGRPMRVQVQPPGSETEGRRGLSVRIVPEVERCEFDRDPVTIKWSEDWTCQEFGVTVWEDALGDKPQDTIRGAVCFYVRNVVYGQVNLRATLIPSEDGRQDRAALSRRASTSAYQSIFVSYAREDAHIVDELQRAYQALGNTCLIDRELLRAGDNWPSVLREKIAQSDVFQLCWSLNSKTSDEVRKEWEFALALGRDSFLRPVFWEEPMPEPPEALRNLGLHFRKLRHGDLDANAGAAGSRRGLR